MLLPFLNFFYLSPKLFCPFSSLIHSLTHSVSPSSLSVSFFVFVFRISKCSLHIHSNIGVLLLLLVAFACTCLVHSSLCDQDVIVRCYIWKSFSPIPIAWKCHEHTQAHAVDTHFHFYPTIPLLWHNKVNPLCQAHLCLFTPVTIHLSPLPGAQEEGFIWVETCECACACLCVPRSCAITVKGEARGESSYCDLHWRLLESLFQTCGGKTNGENERNMNVSVNCWRWEERQEEGEQRDVGGM